MAIGRLGIRSFPKRDRALQLIARHLPSVGYRRGDTLELRFNGPIGEFDSGGAGIFATAVEAILRVTGRHLISDAASIPAAAILNRQNASITSCGTPALTFTRSPS